jgi:hypothetical protein
MYVSPLSISDLVQKASKNKSRKRSRREQIEDNDFDNGEDNENAVGNQQYARMCVCFKHIHVGI